MEELKELTMCKIFDPDFCYDNNVIEVIGSVSCSKRRRVPGNFVWAKWLLDLTAEAIFDVQYMGLSVRCDMFTLQNKQSCFSCCVTKRYTFWRRPKKQGKTLFEMSNVLKGFVSRKATVERNAFIWVVIELLRDPSMVLENEEHGCFFTKYLLLRSST